MVHISATPLDQLHSARIAKSDLSTGGANSVSQQPTTLQVGDEPAISDEAKALLKLYASAGDYVRGQYMEPYAGRVNGNSPPSGYINIEKYNNYLFEKAAGKMVSAASDLGITLKVSDVLAQLKVDNQDIADIQMDERNRKSRAGAESVLYNLTSSDLDNFTDIYIAAKENGLDLEQVAGLAIDRGIQNRYGSTLKEFDIYPYGWDFSETDPDKIAAAKNQLPGSITQKADEIRNKLQGGTGLAGDFVEYLLNPRTGLCSATDDSLDFLSRLIDIYNQQPKGQAKDI
ncbi:hypothetical protein F3J44_08980 [Pantoea sp. Tr-811]|uniref:hypothetical protein n=1 Tax=unclassified Pantoea TaxID=2630326 RepID=UPI00141EA3C5|nr:MULTISPECIES: hypothetical protein [unclassified Pantoea]NIE76529.1 hypothetical protein [Pantoea sp. Ap-967]NIF26522.1 hypothetical protein [Pantoea sp. Tr-811]